MTRVSFITGQINIYLYEVILFVLLGCLVFKYHLHPVFNFYQRLKGLYGYILFIFLSFFILVPRFDLFENIASFFYLLRLFLYIFFFIYFSFHFIKDSKNNQAYTHVLNALCFVIMVVSFVQYFLYPDIRNIVYLGWDPHLYRMVGLFFEPPVAGAVYGLFFLYFLQANSLNKVVRINFLTILFIAVLLTYSRIVYLGFTVSVALWLLSHVERRIAWAFIAVFIIGVIIIPKPFGESVNLFRLFTIESRAKDYQDAIELWKKYPIVGVGYNRIRYIKPETTDFDISSHAAASYHSSFLIVLVTSGIIGLVLFILALKDLSELGSFPLYAVIFLSIVSLGDNILLHPFVLFLFVSMTVSLSSKSLSESFSLHSQHHLEQ